MVVVKLEKYHTTKGTKLFHKVHEEKIFVNFVAYLLCDLSGKTDNYQRDYPLIQFRKKQKIILYCFTNFVSSIWCPG